MVVENVGGKDLKFRNPGRLLMVVIGFLFWAIGFIDLIGHTSAEPDVFGLYSLPFFILIILYGSTIVIWFALFFNPKLLSRVLDAVIFIQNRIWLVIPILIGFGFALWVILEWDRWARLPGLQLSAFGLVIWAVLIMLFTNWSESIDNQTWRKIVTYPLLGLLIVEGILQLVAWIGYLPGTYTIGGDFVPYERIYNNAEGFRNGFANRYGWTFPNVELNSENKRLLMVGGSYLQALQVEPEEQIQAYLTGMLNQDQGVDDAQTEIISIGLPGFGPSPFLFEQFLMELRMEPGAIIVDDIIVFFHLGDDFQSPDPSQNAIMHTVDENGYVEVIPEDARLRHDLTHYYLRGFLATQPVETIRSNYLTFKVISSFTSGRNAEAQAVSQSDQAEMGPSFDRIVGHVTSNYAINEPGHAGIKSTDYEVFEGGNNFLFSTRTSEAAREAENIAGGLLEAAQKIAQEQGMTIRIVTIPVFPEEFFNTYQDQQWDTLIGDYDLLLPEKSLINIAAKSDIPILPMGEFMLNNQLSVEEIRSLYLSNGQGHFTPQGHAYFAEALYSCFYSDSPPPICGDGSE